MKFWKCILQNCINPWEFNLRIFIEIMGYIERSGLPLFEEMNAVFVRVNQIQILKRYLMGSDSTATS
jgi:hypothetical protein